MTNKKRELTQGAAFSEGFPPLLATLADSLTREFGKGVRCLEFALYEDPKSRARSKRKATSTFAYFVRGSFADCAFGLV